jgi:hypothetical protein
MIEAGAKRIPPIIFLTAINKPNSMYFEVMR